eukprot:Pompholyxophrys_sp_v1_NODE_1_length_32789_cov_6.460653.p32 type:complete len:114 gc:universal NODE_1_length_32789_cov_6.460653:5148-4807(-)
MAAVSGTSEERIAKALDDCGISKCKRWYENHQNEIKTVLDKYIDILPLLFVSDMPELNNTFAEILNNHEEVFGGICTHCAWCIIQSHNYKEETLYKRYFGSPTSITKKSLCNN